MRPGRRRKGGMGLRGGDARFVVTWTRIAPKWLSG